MHTLAHINTHNFSSFFSHLFILKFSTLWILCQFQKRSSFRHRPENYRAQIEKIFVLNKYKHTFFLMTNNGLFRDWQRKIKQEQNVKALIFPQCMSWIFQNKYHLLFYYGCCSFRVNIQINEFFIKLFSKEKLELKLKRERFVFFFFFFSSIYRLCHMKFSSLFS